MLSDDADELLNRAVESDLKFIVVYRAFLKPTYQPVERSLQYLQKNIGTMRHREFHVISN